MKQNQHNNVCENIFCKPPSSVNSSASLHCKQSLRNNNSNNNTNQTGMNKLYTLLGKRATLLAALIFGFASIAIAQPANLEGEVATGSWNNNNALTDIGSFRQVRIQASWSGNANYLFNTATGNYNPQWTGSNAPNFVRAVNTNYDGGYYYTSGGWNVNHQTAVTTGNYYTFNIEENSGGNNRMQVLETSFNPTTISSASNTTPANANNSVLVTITSAAAPSSGENVFVRYTTDGYTTSTITQAAFSGTTGTAIIPCVTGGANVSYYIYTSNKTKTQIDADVTSFGQSSHDMASLSVNNNSGSNFTYTQGSGTALSGVYSLGFGGSCATTLATMISNFNSIGTATGVTTVYVAAGFTETAPVAHGYRLTATGTSSFPVTFVKLNTASSTAKPVLTAGVQTAGTTTDAIWKIIGSDYVTIDGFTFQENASNTVVATGATNTVTEMAIGIFGDSTVTTNGAQFNTIKNCTISLNGTNPNSFGIFATSNSTYRNGTGVASATTGTNSNNAIYSNTISNVNFGIYVISPALTATVNESGWDVGGTALSTGNTVTCYYTATANTGIFTSMATTVFGGIIFRNGAGVNIRYNTVTNSLTIPTVGTFVGAGISSGSVPTGITYTSTISNNTVTLTATVTATTAINGIDFGHGIATGTIVGSNNKVTMTVSASHSSTATHTLFGIKANYANAGITCSTDTITISATSTGVVGASLPTINTTALSVVGTAAASSTITASNNLIVININNNSANAGATGLAGTTNGIVANGTGTGLVTTANDNSITINQNFGATTNVAHTIANAIVAMTIGAGTTTTPTANALRNTILIVRGGSTGSGAATAAFSGAVTGILATTATTTLNIGSSGNGNTITIRESNVTNATATNYTSAITYINTAAAHATANVVGNQLLSGTVGGGNPIRSTGQTTGVNCEATVTVLYNVKSNTMNIPRIGASGTVFFTFQTTGPSNVADTVSSNSITFTGLTGTTSVSGISQLGGPSTSGRKSISNNNISITGNNTGTTLGLAWGYSAGASIMSNTINITSAAPTVVGIDGASTSGGAGFFTSATPAPAVDLYGGIANNYVKVNSTSVSPTLAVGIRGTATGPFKIFNNTVDSVLFSAANTASPTLYGIQVSVGVDSIFSNTVNAVLYGTGTNALTGAAAGTMAGIAVTGGTSAMVYNNTIANVSSGSTAASNANTGASATHGILISGGGATAPNNNVFKNKIYGIANNGGSANTGLVNGITVSSTTASAHNNIYNNVIGGITAPNISSADAIRGINFSSVQSTTNNRVYNNSVYLNGTSSGTNFGATGVFHTASTTATTSKLWLSNNVIVNATTFKGTGIASALRRSRIAMYQNWANGDSSNRNFYYAGTLGANNAILSDSLVIYPTAGSSYAFSNYKTTVSSRDVNSFTTEEYSAGNNFDYTVVSGAAQFFTNLTPGNANFLKPFAGITTRVESGGRVITAEGSPALTISDDVTGTTGNRATSPDLGAYEFTGVTPAPSVYSLSVPTATCTMGDSTTVYARVSTVSGSTVDSVRLTYNNGSSVNVLMTLDSGTNGNGRWMGKIPPHTTPGSSVTWSVIAYNSIPLTASATGTSYVYLPLTGSTPNVVRSTSSLCSGSSVTLTARVTAAGIGSVGAGGLTGNGVYQTIFPGGWGGAKSQYLIRASELTAMGLNAGNITSLSFEPTSTVTGHYQGFIVYLNTTTDTALTTTFLSNGTQVYFGQGSADSLFDPVAGSVNTLAFGTGSGSSSTVSWNGTSNVVVTIAWSGKPLRGTSTASSMKYDAAPFSGASAYRQRDSYTSQAMATETSATGTSTSRPKFGFGGNISTNAASATWVDELAASIGSTNPQTTSPTNTPAGSAVKNKFYTATFTINGCTTSATSDTVKVYAMPVAPVMDGTGDPQCGTPTYVATSAASTPTYRFYNVATGGSALETNTTGVYTHTGVPTGTNDTIWTSVTDGVSGCLSDRTQKVVFVSTPDPVEVTASNITTCTNRADSLSVTSGTLVNYDSITWSPTTNLFTDVACTVAYNGTNASKVYFKRASGSGQTIYTVTSYSTGTLCLNTTKDTVNVVANPSISTITATPASLCTGSTVTLNGSSRFGFYGTDTVPKNTTRTTEFEGIFRNGNGTGDFRHQLIYTAAELTAMGMVPTSKISALTFVVTTVGAGSANNYTINLANVSNTTLTTSFLTPTFTQVYLGTTYTAVAGNNTFTFGTGGGSASDFTWDGTSSLLVNICYNISTIGTTSTLGATATANTNLSILGASGGACNSATGTIRPNRPYVLIATTGYDSTSVYTWNWTKTGSSASQLAANTGSTTASNNVAGGADSSVVYTATATSSVAPYCVGTASATAITVKALPVSPTNTSTATQCGTPTYTVTTGLSGTVIYKWYTTATGGSVLSTSSNSMGSASYSYTSYPYAGGANDTLWATVTGATACESDRTMCIVTVNTPPSLTVSPANGSKTLTCVGRIDSVTITSGAASFDSLVWSPITNLYLDVAATVAYNGTGNPTKVYYKRNSATAAEVISLVATNYGTGCLVSTIDSFVVNPNPVVSSATATPSSVCPGATVTLNGTSIVASEGNATVGTQSTTEFGGGVYRYGFGTGDFRHQLLFTAAELNAAGIQAGNITAMTFNVTSVGSGSSNNYTISMAAVSASALTTTFNTTSLTQVYTVGSYTAVSGNNLHTFNTPFNWNGTSDLLINICYTVATLGGSSTLAATTPSSIRNTNLLGSAGACTATTGTTFANRPLVTFTAQVGTNSAASHTWTWSTTGAGGATVATGHNTTHAAVNASGSPISVTYTATATTASTGCYTSLNGTAITVKGTPATPTNTSLAAQCGIPTYTVTTSGYTGTPTISWYSVATGGSALQTGTSTSYVYNAFPYSGGANDTLWASATDTSAAGGCTSARVMCIVAVSTPPNLDLTPLADTMCANAIDSVSISAGTVANYTHYTWSPTTGLYTDAAANVAYTGQNLSKVYVKITAAGSYTYTVTAVDTINSPTCTKTTTITYVINPNPNIVTYTTTPSVICSGSPVTLTGISNGIAAGNATIGAGGTISNAFGISMFSGAWGGTKTQYIVRASELTAAGISAGNITSLAFETDGAAGQQYQGFRIHLGNTGRTVASATMIDSALTQVYLGTEGSVNGFTPATSSVNTLAFGTGGTASSFTWDGTSNIVVSMCWSSNPTSGTATATSILSDATSFTSSAYGKSDNLLPDAFCALNTGFGTSGTAASRPKFTFSAQVASDNSGSFTWAWKDSATNATVLAASSGTINPTATAGNDSSYTYIVTATNTTTSCATTIKSTNVAVYHNPAAPTDATTASQCGTPTYTITTSETGATIKWYAVATGGSPISTGASLSYVYSGLPYPNGNDTLWVSVTKNGCEGARTRIIVAVTAAATFTINPTTKNACVGRIDTLTVTAGVASFTSITWAPTTNLYSDAAGTVPYTPGTKDTIVYYKRASTSSADTITATATDGVCTTTASAIFTVNGNPVITAKTATPASVCSGSTVTLNGASIVAGNGTATIGTASTTVGTTGVPYRTGNGVGNQIKNQYLITAAELSAAGVQAGNITSMAFDLTVASGEMTGMTFRVAATSATTLTTTFETPSFTTVLTEASYTPVVGTNTHTFSTPFNWNGTSNLLFDLCGTVASGSGCTANAYTPSGFTGSNHAAGSATACANTTGATSVKPVIIIGGQVGVNLTSSYTWSWTTQHSGGSITNGSTTSHVPTNVTGSPISNRYIVTATNTTTTCATTDSTSAVAVNPIPTVTATSTVNQTGTPTFTATSTYASPSYSWFTAMSGGTALATNTSGSYVYTGYSVGGNVLYVAVTSNGCTSAARVKDSVNVTAANAITLSTGSTKTTCQYRIDTITVTSDTLDYDTYTWSATSSNSLFTNAAATTPYTSGSYTTIYHKNNLSGLDTVTVLGNKVSPASSNNTSVIFTNTAAPVIDTVRGLPSKLCSGATVTLTGKINGAAPGTATLGTGTTLNTTTTYPTVFGNYFWGAKHQYLITAAELLASGVRVGNMTSVAFDITTVATAALTDYTISMGNTNTSALSSFLGGLTQVYYNASYTPSASTGYANNIITFDAPFVWDGTSNVVIDICFNNAAFTTNAVCNQSATSYTSTIWRNGDAAGQCALASVSSISRRPNMRFGAQIVSDASANYNWSWTSSQGGSIASTNISSHTPTASGNVYSLVTYTATATSIAAPYCVGSATSIADTVYPIPTATVTTLADTICAGNSKTISTALTGVGPWSLTFYNGTTGVTTANIASSPRDTTISPSATTTYSVTAVSANGCTGTFSGSSEISVISAAPAGYTHNWKGGTSNDWSVASNWCSNSVPTSNDSAYVGNSAFLRNQPSLSASAAVHKLGVASTSTLTIGSGHTLSAGGNVSKIGDITGTGTLLLNGTATQTISGSGTMASNLTINKASANAVMAANVTVPGALTLTSGDLDVNGHSLTLAGTVSGATSILATSTASTVVLSGPATVPTQLGNTVANLTISRVGGVTLSGNLATTESLVQTAGKLAIDSNTLTIGGTITNDATNSLTGGKKSKLVATTANGIAYFDQTTSADVTVKDGTNALMNLEKTGSGTFVIGNKVNVFNKLASTGGTLDLGGNVVLRSTDSSTAYVAKVTGTVTGQAVVERFMHRQQRGWRAVTAPVTFNGIISADNNKVKNNWQNDFGYSSGYGTRISAFVTPSPANGIDDLTSGNSLQTYNSTTGAWNKINNTVTETQSGSTSTAANKGFFLFVRGDRTVTPAGSTPNAFASTIIASKGLLQTGTQVFNFTGGANKSWLVGNPYAAPIDMESVASNNVGQYLYIWDPNLAGFSPNTSGNYATFDRSSWNAGPSSGLNTKYFQSGQAFFVIPSSATASLTFTEDDKASSTWNNTQSTGSANGLADIFNVKLLSVKPDGTRSEVDGVRAKFGANYSTDVDANDGVKWSTAGIENLSLSRNSKSLVIESRPYITTTDSLFLNMATVSSGANYEFKVNPINFDATVSSCKLVDNFLNTETPISLTGVTVVGFNVTSVAGSSAANRFHFVFNGAGSLTSNSLNVKAYKKNNSIVVDWEAIAENNIKMYDVEKSADGNNFGKLANENAKNGNTNNKYSIVDNNPVIGVNYYRIKSIQSNNGTKYSTIVRVEMTEKGIKSITVYPNPVKGNVIGVQMNNLDAGSYTARLFNAAGQEIWSRGIMHNGNNGSISLQLKNVLSSGSYQLQLTNEAKGTKYLQTVLVVE